MIKKLLFTCCIVGICSQISIYAQNKDTLDADLSEALDLSLEDLMNVQVTSSTKSGVSIQKAPSVIRVFSKEDFQKFGFTTLQDVLNTVPGMQIQEYRAGHQLVWIRGVQARYNNKVLLLIDGIPMRDGYYGNFNVDEMIPLETIEKIEIINGPGSVLYGSNGLSGVISITTKDKGKSIGADYASFNTYSVNGEFNTNNLYVNANIYHSDGFNPALMSDGKNRTVNQTTNGQFGLAKFKKGNLTVIGGVAGYSHPYRYRSTKKEYRFDRLPIFGSIKYDKTLKDSSSININTYTNYYLFNRSKIKYINSTSDTLKETSENSLNGMLTGGEAEYHKNLNKQDLTLGLSWQNDRSLDMHENITYSIDGPDDLGREESILNPNFSRNDIAFYLQDVINLSKNVNVTGGIRYDLLSNFDNQFNYRFGLTGKMNDNFYGKALYGTAFRVPSYREYITTDAPNLNLTPEHLKTFETQLGYVKKQYELNVTFFNNSYENFIQEIVVDSIRNSDGSFTEIDDEMAFNWQSRAISGLEFNGIVNMSQFNLNAGVTYFLSAKERLGALDTSIYTSQTLVTGETDIYFLSDLSGHVALSYTLNKKHTFGLNTMLVGQRLVSSDYQSDSETQDPNNANGFLKFDFYANFKPTENLRIGLKTMNLLDSNIYSPPYGGSGGYDVQWPGRQIRAEIKYIFK